MADLRRVEVVWSGAWGLPGVSVFYSADPDDATAGLAAFFSSISNRFPNSLTWSCGTSGDTVDVATGTLTGEWTGGTAINQTGSGGTGAYAAGTGAYVQWGTPLIVGGRRLKGRTFLAPLLASEYQADGSITAACLTTLNTAAATLEALGKIVIWHRPSPGGSNGIAATVTSGNVPDQVTSLKTRRR